jgi:NAD(P)-dependent dehydrogenase (short-subunit alcohol dehydrogenase family)
MSKYNHDTTGLEIVNDFQKEVEGKTILITGTSDKGLGAETAISLAHANPAHLILLARSANKVSPVQDKIKSVNPDVKTTFVPIELDDFESVRKAAAKVNDIVDKIDIVINNAGIMAVAKYTTNKSGIESQFATNHLGHFLLTALIFQKVKAAGPSARIVNLTSNGHQLCPFRPEDYNFRDGNEYDPWSGYGASKTANILFTLELAEKGITSLAVHPGLIMDTSLGSHLDMSTFEQDLEVGLKNTGRKFVLDAVPKTAQQGVSSTLRAALDPGLVSSSGSYIANCQPEAPYEYATSTETAEKLWHLSEKLVEQKFDI